MQQPPNESDFYKKIVLNSHRIHVNFIWGSIVWSIERLMKNKSGKNFEVIGDLNLLKKQLDHLIKYIESDELDLRDKDCLDYYTAHMHNVTLSFIKCESYLLDKHPRTRAFIELMCDAWSGVSTVEDDLFYAEELLNEEEVKSNV